jgi:hypothetical protein
MTIHLRQNQYLGVNAHLHSALQNEPGGWKVFHSAHINDLARAIDAKLPPGYEVALEKSLQIVEYHPDTGVRVRRRPEPDVTIYEVDPSARSAISSFGSAAVPTLILPAIETVEHDEELYLTSVLIYGANESERKAVTRIELLSPTNKPPGDGYLQYREKRNATLEAGTPLIEIDYLHETPSPIKGIPSYPDREAKSYPYYFAITDTRVSLEEGETRVFAFAVDEAIRILDIPLAGDEILTLDLNPVYNQTFESLSYFSNRVDYEQQPVRFDTYSEADQQRIRARMAEVLQAHRRSSN